MSSSLDQVARRLTFWMEADRRDDGRMVKDAETLALEDVPKTTGLVGRRRENEEILKRAIQAIQTRRQRRMDEGRAGSNL